MSTGTETGEGSAERLGRGKPPVAEIRLLDGQAVLTDILLDGVSIRETVKQQAK